MGQVSRNSTKDLILFLMVLILFTLDRLGVLVEFKRNISYPLEYAQIPVFLAKNYLESKVEFLVNLGKIEKENITLSQKLAEVIAENAKLQNLGAENEALRTQLGATIGIEKKSIPAKVIGLARSLIILPESNNLIKVGSIVTLGNNYIGQVSEVSPTLVKAKLPTDATSSIPAVILTPAGPVRGNLSGKFGTKLVLEKVETQELVPEGAIVQTLGSDKILPGLVLGKVKKVEKLDPEPFLDIEVESFVNFPKLETVFILEN